MTGAPTAAGARPHLRLLRFLALAAIAGCGARSQLLYGPPKPECVIDDDCYKHHEVDLCKPRACQKVADAGAGGDGTELVAKCVDLPVVTCDDGDPCTTDTCDPATAACSHGPATFDLDGDGHRAPRPGFAPGAPDSCGDDCDDTNKNAFPGNLEVCDGVDNDCNGIVDDNASFIPLGSGDIRVSGDVPPAGPGGLAYSGESYAAVYYGSTNGTQVYVSTISNAGEVLKPPGEQKVTDIAADSAGGPITWVGDRYGVGWSDRRTGDYEIFFTLLGADGSKKHHDVQISAASGFSLSPSLAWTTQEFLLVWQDRRDVTFNLYGQRIGLDANPIGGNIQLTFDTSGFENESPSVAAGQQNVGIAWALDDAVSSTIRFQTFSFDLSQPASQVVDITDGTGKPSFPNAVWNRDRYVIAWYEDSLSPKAIFAATVGSDGVIITQPRQVTQPPGTKRSRYPVLRPLGDRVLLVYSDTRDGNQGYEIYARMLSPTLDPLSPEMRVTNAPGDSIEPVVTFGPEGDVGILFRDDRENGQHNVYFTRLGCVATTP